MVPNAQNPLNSEFYFVLGDSVNGEQKKQHLIILVQMKK